MTDLVELFNENTKDFQETTPQGNEISGKILLNHGYYHGSLLIESINGKLTNQFVRGFPKIHYFDDGDEFEDGNIYAYEKLDGTCVGLYWLYDENNHKIELVPKSRQKAVLDEHFQEMLHYCDLRMLGLFEFPFEVVYFELYGMLNEHTLPHKKTYIDVKLIGGVGEDKSTLMSPKHLEALSSLIKVQSPKLMFNITKTECLDGEYKYLLETCDEHFPDVWLKLLGKRKVMCDSTKEIIENIQKYIDKCNEVYKEEKGYMKYEGVVLRCPKEYFPLNTTHYIKIKSTQFKEDTSGKLNVPLDEIKKEIRKIINENLTTYVEEYDEKETIVLINEYLSEDFEGDDIYNRKVQNVIEKELHKYIDSICDKSTNKIVDDILNKNTSNDIKELMRCFADNYPLMKHKAGDVYTILSKRLKKVG